MMIPLMSRPTQKLYHSRQMTLLSVSGYQKLNGSLAQPHNLVRHPDMPEAAFADMWYT